MLLSLIIPVYKVENYIEDCIESICCQLCDGVEVIIVNDGTPDQSIVLAKKYINSNYKQFLSHFTFIEQENQGQSGARNNGVKVAKGDFVAFVDSDDFIDRSYIKNILDNINNEIDILSFCGQMVGEKVKRKKIINKNLSAGSYCGDFNFLKENFNNCEWMCWTRVVRRSFFKDNEFPIGVYLEDMYFFMSIYKMDVKIKHIDLILYYYRSHSLSSTQSKSIKYYNSFVFMLDHLIKLIENSNVDLYKELHKVSLYKTLDSYVYELAYLNSLSEALFRLKKYDKYIKLKHYNLFVFRFFVNSVRKLLGKFN